MPQKPDRPRRPISLRVPADVLDEMARRYKVPDGDRETGRSLAGRAALDRYYEMCRRQFPRLRLEYSRGELGLLCAVHNGGMLAYDFGDDRRASTMLAVSMWHELADTIALHPGYGKQWDVSDEAAHALVAKLQAASFPDIITLVDFIEMFWADDPEAQQVTLTCPRGA
jgi:hypothetical protein